MKNYLPVLKQAKIFAGMKENEIFDMLDCLQARLVMYKKGEYVFHQGEHLKHIMILTKGKLHIQREDYWGNRSIINVIGIGEMFGEAFAVPDSGTVLSDVAAVEESSVVFLDMERILTVCPSACKSHSLVIQNLIFAISEKNRSLVRKLNHMEKRTTREKLISYLSEEAERQKSGTFTIPFNRQELADFLSVDRSALSKELCRMRDEGLLVFKKNRFSLLAAASDSQSLL